MPEVGGMLHLDHINFQIPEHDLATVFFINGLGLTRDPFRRADETNMGVNVGQQQFHLPRRGATPPFPGVVGLVVPELAAIGARLKRLERLGKFTDTPFAAAFEEDTAEITSPFGFRLRLHAAGTVAFLQPLGMKYVEIFIPPGTAGAIANFYREIFRAITGVETIDGAPTAIINAGPFQTLRFIESEHENHDTHNFHVSFHVTHYNEVRERIADSGALVGEGRGQVFFFNRIFDPETGVTVFPLENEVRSIYHPDFMRPLVNRWPIVNEPFSDQAEEMADLKQELGFEPGATSFKE
jgi:hypothetical protein